MSTQTSNHKINSLQGLRAIAFLGIFLAHSGIKKFGPAGALGVSIFYILSGFVMIYSYYGKERIQSTGLLDNLKFAWFKIRPLYPLHLLTTALMLVFLIFGSEANTIPQIITKLVLNLLLIQEWFPIADAAINGVSWYLSVSLFCYFLFPWLLRAFEKIQKKRDAILILVLLIEFQFLIVLLASQVSTPANDMNGWLTDNYTYWLSYKFPPIRLIDFLIGCDLGLLWKLSASGANEEQIASLRSNLCMIIAICLALGAQFFVLSSYAAQNFLPNTNSHWWTTALIYSIPSCLLIWYTARENNLFARFLSTDFMAKFGNLTRYAFLIHFTVFAYIAAVVRAIGGKAFYKSYGSYIKLVVGLIITIILTLLWEHLSEGRKQKKAN